MFILPVVGESGRPFPSYINHSLLWYIHSCLDLPLQYKTSNSHYLCLFVETPINLRCLLIKALQFPATAKLCVSPVPEASSLLGLWSFFWREAIMWEEPWETQVHSSDHQLPSCPFTLYEFIGFSFLLRAMNALYICSNFSHNSVLQIWQVINILLDMCDSDSGKV